MYETTGNCKVVVLLLLLLLGTPLLGTLAVAPAFGTLLQGNVTEERRLPLPDWQRDILPTLTPGQPWDDTKLPRSFTEELWVKIPNWLAGVWQTTGPSNNYAVVNGQLAYEGTSSVSAAQTYGEQVDRAGQVWDLLRYPSTRTTQTPSTVGFFVSLGPGTTMGLTSSGQYVRESSSIEIQVDRASSIIRSVKSRQDRFITSIASDGTLTDTDQILDPSTGQPTTVLQTKDYRVQPFAVVNIGPTTGFNVRKSFQMYLTKNGMGNLL